MARGLSDADEQQVNGVKAAVGLAIRTTCHRLLKLKKLASILVGKLARTADEGVLTTLNDRTSLLWLFRKLFLAKGLCTEAP